jgi:hypothetical protein
MLTLLPVAWAAGPGACATAQVPEPFVLPDGSEHPAGSLRICPVQRHVPTTELLVSYVNGKQIGLLLGTSGHNEIGPGEESFMIFARDPAGRLQLYGYVIQEGDRLATYRLERPDRLRAALEWSLLRPERYRNEEA